MHARLAREKVRNHHDVVLSDISLADMAKSHTNFWMSPIFPLGGSPRNCAREWFNLLALALGC